jgi:hypothetical protein
MSNLILKLMRTPGGRGAGAPSPAKETVLVLENSLEDRVRRLRALTAQRRGIVPPGAAPNSKRRAAERAR